MDKSLSLIHIFCGRFLRQTFGNLCHNEFSVSVYDLSADRKAFQYDGPYFPAGKPPEGVDTEDGS